MGERLTLSLGLLAILAGTRAAPAEFPEFTHNELSVERLARDGDAAPGMPEAFTFGNVAGHGVLGPWGGVTLEPEIRGPGVQRGVNDRILYTLRGNQLSALVRLGDPAPGIEPPMTFDRMFNTASVNSAGDVIFDWYPLNGTSPASSWIVRSQPGLLAMKGMSAPGTDGMQFNYQAYNVYQGGGGHVTFASAVGPPGANVDSWWGVWSDRGGAMTPIYKDGDPAPAPLTGLTMHAFPLKMTRDDRLVLGARLQGPDITKANDTAVMAERNGGLELIAREAAPAPGAGGAVFGGDVYFAFVNPDGRVAANLTLSGPGVTAENNAGIWSEAAGPLRLVARRGDLAPGAGDNVRFAHFATPRLNSSGQTLFFSLLTDGASPEYDSLWLDDAGSLAMLAKEGQFAPGFGPNSTFGVLYYDDSLAINNAGDIVFEARVYSSGLSHTPDAVYLMENGLPKLFMSNWQMFDGQLVGGIDVVGLNELRQLLLFITFVGPDGAIFTPDDSHGYYLITIPEPATLLLLGLAGMPLPKRQALRRR